MTAPTLRTGHPRATRPGWTVLLPLKGGATAKSRLRVAPPVATAIARDCLSAVVGCPAVRETVVVTSDETVAAHALATGARAVPEARPGAGLLAALRDGLRILAHGEPGPCAVLLGDLPAVRAEDLHVALDAAWTTLRAHPLVPTMVFVPDTEGTGTVLLAARGAPALDPAFGTDSARAHERRGAVRLNLDLPRLRRDVDTPGDLRHAVALGIGPHTATALAETGTCR